MSRHFAWRRLVIAALLPAVLAACGSTQARDEQDRAILCRNLATFAADVQDLAALDASSTANQVTATWESTLTAWTNVRTSAALVAADDYNALSTAVDSLGAAVRALPPGTDAATAQAELADEVAAVLEARRQVDQRLGCLASPSA